MSDEPQQQIEAAPALPPSREPMSDATAASVLVQALAPALSSDVLGPDACLMPGIERGEIEFVDRLVRELSRKADPNELSALFERATSHYFPNADRWLTLSRHGLSYPQFRLTRSSDWQTPPDPWREEHKLPVYHGGVLAELVYGGGARIVDPVVFAPDDPALDLLDGMSCLAVVPVYDLGRQTNVGVWLWRDRTRADLTQYPLMLWLSNLFARTSHNLILRRQLSAALAAIEAEMHSVGAIQRGLLPASLPVVPGVELAAHHQAARRAGGDYYDVRLFDGGRTLALFLGDVSGHGAPSTVGVGIVHALLRSFDEGLLRDPSAVLGKLNRVLTEHYTHGLGSFVTAFYALLDTATGTLRSANAGHPPPRLRRAAGGMAALPGETGLPLGVDADERYATHADPLSPGDALLLFTDGCFETTNVEGKMFGLDRLDATVASAPDASAAGLVERVKSALHRFAGTTVLNDDATLLGVRVV